MSHVLMLLRFKRLLVSIQHPLVHFYFGGAGLNKIGKQPNKAGGEGNNPTQGRIGDAARLI
jgi:hypothetical protein